MTRLPTGTLTFLFTDVEGSTSRWEEQPEAMKADLARHDAILRESVERHGGYTFKTVGDAFHATFATPGAALRAAVDVQRALAAAGWGGAVRMALDTGVADERDSDYFGPPLNRVARLREAAHGGQTLLSAVTAGLLRGQVPDGVELRDLGAHRLRDLAGSEHIFQAAIWGLPAEFPPLRLQDEHPMNLPTPLTNLVGREREQDEVARLLERARLVTLSGPGGTGKTRLALAVAESVRARFPDGVWFVDLSPISDFRLVVSVIAQVIGLREDQRQTIEERLAAYLSQKRLLLILDNFEQVVDAAPLVRDLLAASPSLVVLVTSRMVLRLTAEQEYPVPPLQVPDPAMPAAALAAVRAVALFVERAQQVRPDFAVTAGNAAAIADICVKLDGLPLAIELAAVRTRLLSPEAIRARLDERLQLLTGGPRDMPARQQTLRDTIAWSHDLLTSQEQVLFRRLSVFAGGWTLEAAEAICADGPEAEQGVAPHDVLDLLTRLLDKSLVAPGGEAAGENRFRLLESIRQYGAEKLAAANETARVQLRHRDWFLQLAELGERHLSGPDQSHWLARLEADHDNLRATLGWCLEHGDSEAALRCTGALWRFWQMHGYLSEGRWWLEQASRSAAAAPPALRARTLLGAGELARLQGDFAAACERFDGALTLHREMDDKHGIAYALNSLGIVSYAQGDFTEAEEFFRESLALRREIGDTRGVATSLGNLAGVARSHGQYGDAAALVEESLDLYRKLTDSYNIARTLSNLASMKRLDGDLLQASHLLRESLEIRRQLGDKYGIAASLNNLAAIAREQQNYADAEQYLRDSLRLFQELGNREYVASCLEDAAKLALAIAEADTVVVLLGAAAALRSTIVAALPPTERAERDHTEAVARARMDSAAFERAWAAGQVLTVDQAVDIALASIAPLCAGLAPSGL